MSKMINPRCHVGETHGIYTIVDVLNEKDNHGHWIYKCICSECGFPKFSHYGKISGNKSKTMHCNHLRSNGSYVIRGQWHNARIKRIFKDMINRCYNQKDKSYRWYGAKGISICDEWLNNPILFEQWALNNGYDSVLTIDRIDSELGYYPNNCRWIPLSENARRAGNVNWITVANTTLTGRQWAEKLGLGVLTINKYIHTYGVNITAQLIVAMLNEPPSTKHRKSHQTWLSVYGIQI